MYFNSNMKILRKRRGKTQDELAFALDMKRSTLSGYENKVAEPGLEILLKFSDYFGIAIDTLLKVDMSLLGESQIYQLEHGQDVFISGSKLRVLATTVNNENKENIEMVNEKAKAGYTNGFSDPEFISELPVFNLPFLSGNKKYRTFQLNGDSMLPIPDKSWVTGEFVQDWREVKSGDACVILTLNEGIVFKIIENKIAEEGKLTLFSLNPIYEPFDVEVRDIREIWRFTHYISSDIPEPYIPQSDLTKTVAHIKKEMNILKSRINR
ncbi:MAG: LexA family transcriptional regulator [Bacteroidales bacterium]|nr:LexA family transcriptional regulator [Bacteroidales bacterium]